jgi:mRNA interferase YafQ
VSYATGSDVRRVVQHTAFERDLRRLKKQGKQLDKLEAIVDRLQASKLLPPRCRLLPLRGEWEGHWDCHVEPDWLLLYKLTPDKLILVRTVSHSDLFGR